MSHRLIDRNPDLKRLQDEGFELAINGGYLLVCGVPYVTTACQVARGTLVSELTLSGDMTTKPLNHVIHFIGDHPCNIDGSIIAGIRHASGNGNLGNGIVTNHSFSNKPPNGYQDYHHKIVTYVDIIAAPAQALDPAATAKTFRPVESDDPESVFVYVDTNSSRADIGSVASKLTGLKIGIIGLGGTGSYVLDFVAKTPVKEIRLFDSDAFLQHNAFRAPGAISLEELRKQPAKVAYMHEVYSRMRRGIVANQCELTTANVSLLSGLDFVFVCIDKGEAKRSILQKLMDDGVPFVDVGMGVELTDSALMGIVRTTACTERKTDHLERRIAFRDGNNNMYAQNIQIAELNALNAAMAVIKWKKLFGYYHDRGKENNALYAIDTNSLINEETDA